jgi:cytidine deaminase
MSRSIPFDEMEAAAVRARQNAHAPYSQFSVGAAVLCDGRIYASCNVENAAYPVGSCAERGAISAMVADGGKRVEALVIVAGPQIPPCGMCRQAIAEFADSDVPILLVGLDDQRRMRMRFGDLFPQPFGL